MGGWKYSLKFRKIFNDGNDDDDDYDNNNDNKLIVFCGVWESGCVLERVSC